MLNDIIKIDLHIHSVLSSYKDGDIVNSSNTTNIDLLIKKLEDNKINLFSITDHNRFDYELYIELKERIKTSSIIQNILPGIEFDVSLEKEHDHCHIIAVFDDSEQQKIKEIWDKILEIRMLKKKDDYYSIEEFEKILKNIRLKVCLIVHQKQGINNKNGDTQSLSNATSNPSYFIKTGYIDSLEYSHPRIEGIVKKSLRDISVDFPLITGSDCHQWEAYPYRELGKKVKRDFTILKCLPTFKGLTLSITSFSSRANRIKNNNPSYISKINIRGRSLPLSNGLNAIIGDNGSGKSLLATLLSGKPQQKYYKQLIQENEMSYSTSSAFTQDNLCYVSQGQIVEQVRDGKLFESSNQDYYKDISTKETFKSSINTYFDNLANFIKSNITKNSIFNKMNSCKIEIETTNGVFFHPVINIQLTSIDSNVFQDRVEAMKRITDLLSSEISTNELFYKSIDLYDQLGDALTILNNSRQVLIDKSTNLENVKKTKQMIVRILSEYDLSLNKKRTSEETRRNRIKQKYSDFTKSIIDYIQIENLPNNLPVFPSPLDGYSKKTKGSYIFQKTAAYHKQNLEEAFFKYCFNLNFQSIDKIKSIKNKQEFSAALSNYDADQLVEFKNKKLSSFIEEWSKEVTTISEVSLNQSIGNTPGEISLVYYKFLTGGLTEEYSVLIIDQPEDDINPKRINEYLLKYLSTVRDKMQVILVTHNPLLVVNLDVDNLIYINKKNNNLEIKYGCLEYEGEYNVLELVKNHLDGGYKAIERRLKAYDRDRD